MIILTYVPPDSIANHPDNTFKLKEGCYMAMCGELGALEVKENQIIKYKMTLSQYYTLVKNVLKNNVKPE
jgi:hypothetical protein